MLTVYDGQVVRYADETFGLPLETAMEVGRPWEQIETWPPPSPRPRPGRPRRRGIRPADRGHVASQHHRRHHRGAGSCGCSSRRCSPPPGAKMGANIARHQATSGHNELVSSQVNGMLGYKQRRLATAQA